MISFPENVTLKKSDVVKLVVINRHLLDGSPVAACVNARGFLAMRHQWQDNLEWFKLINFRFFKDTGCSNDQLARFVEEMYDENAKIWQDGWVYCGY